MAKKIKTRPDSETTEDAAAAEASAATAAKGGVEDGAVEATAVEVVTGPRIKMEDGSFVSVPEGDQRQRRLLLNGKNVEHVSDVEDQGETVWVYRQM